MGMVQEFKSWSRRQGAPVTVGFLVSLPVVALILWFLRGNAIAALVFSGLSKPWTAITYPWAYTPFDVFGLLSYVFLVMWTLSIGGTIERELGAVRYGALLTAVTVLPALLCGIVGIASGTPALLMGPWLSVGALTVIWGTRSPEATVRLYAILPIQAKWLAIITVLGTLLSYGYANPLMGVAACGGYGLAYLFAAGKVPGLTYRAPRGGYRQSKASRESEARYYDDVLRREREREERERLRKLFENSLKDDK